MRARVLTALILIPIVLAILVSASPLPIFGLSALVAGAAYKELSLLGGMERSPFPFVPLIAFLAFGLVGLAQASSGLLALLLGLTLLGLAAAPYWVKEKQRPLLEAASLWCICPLLAVATLHSLYAPQTGWWTFNSPLFLVLVPLWIGDSLAYFVGKAVGKHLLAPKISPKKTVEGAVANLVGCVGGSIAVGAAIAVPLWISATCGALAGVLGQLGDLMESALKRSAGLKDTGSLLPGHGGILDRIDSFLLSAPCQALFLALAWPPHLNR